MFRPKQLAITLLLAFCLGGVYVLRDELPPIGGMDDAGAVTQGSYQHIWRAQFGPEIELTYHLKYECQHDIYLAESELAGNLATLSSDQITTLINRMQLENQQGDRVTLLGDVPMLCRECSSYYLVSEQDGYVAVFRGRTRQGALLDRLYDEMPVSRLPSQQQEQLRIGIIAESEDELARILEGLDR